MLSLSKLASRSSRAKGSDTPRTCRSPSSTPKSRVPPLVLAKRCYIASSARASPALTSPASTFNPGCVPAMVATGSMAMTTALPSSPS